MTNKNSDIINKAKQLFSQSFTQEADEAKETMQQFEELYKSNKTSEEVAFIYSKALLNLVDKLQIDDAVATIEKLKNLLNEHKDNQAIAVRYSRGLANLIYKQDAKAAAESIKLLELLQSEYSAHSEVASGYVGGLVNLTIKGRNANEAIEIINKLIDEFNDDEGFVNFAEKSIKVIQHKQVNQ